jgi:hypothetical protein
VKRGSTPVNEPTVSTTASASSPQSSVNPAAHRIGSALRRQTYQLIARQLAITAR